MNTVKVLNKRFNIITNADNTIKMIMHVDIELNGEPSTVDVDITEFLHRYNQKQDISDFFDKYLKKYQSKPIVQLESNVNGQKEIIEMDMTEFLNDFNNEA